MVSGSVFVVSCEVKVVVFDAVFVADADACTSCASAAVSLIGVDDDGD